MSAHPLDFAPRIPRTCIWEITGACNLRCIHCENRSGERGASELSFEAMVRVAEGLARLGCKTVDLTGGEPLMRAGWTDLCGRLRELGMQVAIITNGTRLDDTALDAAIDSGVGLIGISIDGLEEVHDQTRLRPGGGPSPWQQAMAAIERTAARLPLRVITQINRQNIHQLAALGQLLRDKGVARWQLQLAVPEGRLLDFQGPYVIDPSQLEGIASFIARSRASGEPPFIDVSNTLGYFSEHELALRQRVTGQGVWLGCQGGVRSVAITYNGKVRGCSAMPADFDAGDLHSESIEEIWQDPTRFAFSTAFDVDKLSGECARCGYGPLCRAGCTAMAFCVGGSIYENRHCLVSAAAVARNPQPIVEAGGHP